jgi:hypothetical protein
MGSFSKEAVHLLNGDGQFDELPAPRLLTATSFPGAPALARMHHQWNVAALTAIAQRHPNAALRATALDLLHYGCDIGIALDGLDMQSFCDELPPADPQFSPADFEAIQTAIERYLREGTLVEIVHQPGMFAYHRVFAVPSGPKIRVVHDLSAPRANGRPAVNDLIGLDGVRQLTLASSFLPRAIADGFVLAHASDISGAYRTLAVRPGQAHLQCFSFAGKQYANLSLLFGSRKAGADWGVVAALIHFELQTRLDAAFGLDMCRVAHVGDDTLVVFRHAHLFAQGEAIIRSLQVELNAPVNPAKTQSGTCVVFIGLVVDLASAAIACKAVRQAKVLATLADLEADIRAGRISRQRLMSLAGTIAFLKSQTEFGSSLCHNLNKAAHAPGRARMLTVPAAVADDMAVLARLLAIARPRRVLAEKYAFLLSDASGKGHAGAYLCQRALSVEFLHFELGEHHNLHNANAKADSSSAVIELGTIAVALATFAPRLADHTVVVVCDSAAAVACVNKLYSPIAHLAKLCTAIGCLAVSHSLSVRAVHLPRARMVPADLLSRGLVPEFLALVPTPSPCTEVDPAMVALLLSPASSAIAIAKAIVPAPL